MRRIPMVVGLFAFLSLSALAQAPQSSSEIQQTPGLKITSRAVLVDVIVTDRSGKPVTGLPMDAFAVTEQGKPQAISFFEEHGPSAPAQLVDSPKLPPNTFSNFSPFPEPAAVNVVLLDSLNTRMESQSDVHRQVLDFLKSAKPGTRSAIFTMGLGLHFIQGFNDDPAVLAAALKGKRNNEVEPSVMLKGQDETSAQQKLIGMMSTFVGGHDGVNQTTAAPANMIADQQRFTTINDTARSFDRMFLTLANLQKLAMFLQGFPGRKNIIWFAEKFPSAFLAGGGSSEDRLLNLKGDPNSGAEIKRTLSMLATARAAIYPVDARGISIVAAFTAENNPIDSRGASAEAIRTEDEVRDADQITAKLLAQESGGRAFANTNSLSDVIARVTAESSHFYTLSYSPVDTNMDGRLRNLEVKVQGGKYTLSYRRGYFAVDGALPGSAMSIREAQLRKLAAKNPGAADPLLPFMDLGMPQNQQIVFNVHITPASAEPKPGEEDNNQHYKIDFSVDPGYLDLNLESNGQRTGALSISLIVYDRYGNVASREDHLAELNISPDTYKVFESRGVQLHAQLATPAGNYWLRAGIYDRRAQRAGTLEIPLQTVNPTAAKTK